MKKTMMMACLVMIIASCEKMDDFEPRGRKDKVETVCPVVSSESMPSSIIKSFNQKYTDAKEVTWFDKDRIAYCAVFTFNGKQTKALFNHEGNFVSQEVETDNEAENDDNDAGCECELNDGE